MYFMTSARFSVENSEIVVSRLSQVELKLHRLVKPSTRTRPVIYCLCRGQHLCIAGREDIIYIHKLSAEEIKKVYGGDPGEIQLNVSIEEAFSALFVISFETAIKDLHLSNNNQAPTTSYSPLLNRANTYYARGIDRVGEKGVLDAWLSHKPDEVPEKIDFVAFYTNGTRINEMNVDRYRACSIQIDYMTMTYSWDLQSGQLEPTCDEIVGFIQSIIEIQTGMSCHMRAAEKMFYF